MTKNLFSILVSASLGSLLVLGDGCGSSGELGPYDDPAPHAAGFVTVADGVRLHYLDFGGAGPPLLFLAGSGDSAHIFDELAPRFVAGFHVLALTRRGFGESSQPASGYDTGTLANDIAGLMDALGLTHAYIAGHSLAGAEMTRFAIEHPERVLGLVYLDAAYDWAASAQDQSTSPAPVPPAPTPAQLASPDGFASYVAWTNGVPGFPLAEVRATSVFDCSGQYVGPKTPAAIATSFAVAAAAEHPDYAHVVVPVLAIYTVPKSASDMFPWLTEGSPQTPVANAFFPSAQAGLASQRATFAAAQPSGRVVELPSVPHFLFLAEPDEITASMTAFLSALRGGR